MSDCPECGCESYCDICGTCASCVIQFQADEDERFKRLESEIELYKKALTLAVTLPMGVIPHDKEFYTQMVDGLCVVKRSKADE